MGSKGSAASTPSNNIPNPAYGDMCKGTKDPEPGSAATGSGRSGGIRAVVVSATASVGGSAKTGE